MSKQELYIYSLDGDTFEEQSGESDEDPHGWETREEALLAGRERTQLVARLKGEEPSPVWTAIKVPCVADAYFPTADMLHEAMSDIAEGEVGSEMLDGWPDIDEETAGKELQEFVEETLHPFLEKWVEKHDLQPTFWAVTEVVKHADDDAAIDEGPTVEDLT